MTGMSMLWLAPAVLAGLALVAVPIAIHLLVREQRRRIDYPSLRFLRQSQPAAFRRRTVQDALLLICRVAIVTAGVLALAGPVLQTASRIAGHATRVARAVILVPGADAAAGQQAAGEAFVSQAFARGDVADAIADAQRWLAAQPPAVREVVFVGALRRGDLSSGHLRALSASTGIRFVRTAGAAVDRDISFTVLTSRDGGLVLQERRARLDDDRTEVREGVVRAAAADVVRIVAAEAEQPVADAALRAAIGAGLRWQEPSQRVVIAWPGADDQAVQRVLKGASLVRMDRPAPLSSAASAVAEAVMRVTAPADDGLEPVAIDDDDLKAWSRSPGPPPADAPPMDEGDRRWLWALALALLALEHGLRRSTPIRSAVQPTAEARVA